MPPASTRRSGTVGSLQDSRRSRLDAWTDLDIVASEARVWRSLGKGPDEARDQRASGGGALPPESRSDGRRCGSDRDDVSYGVTDPPGTRGTMANTGPDGMPLP